MAVKGDGLGARRVVLDGVPRVAFYFDAQKYDDSKMRCPEDVPFPSCLRACLEYLGDGLGCRQVREYGKSWGNVCGYALLMGITGAAFRLNWKPGWHPDNCAGFLVDDDPSGIFQRAFRAIGYETEIVCKTMEGMDSEEYFRAKIMEQIRDRGRPVIAHGVIGPPEECIITGYDEGGDVLIGWSFFQHFPDFAQGVEFEPNGMFRKRDWFKDTWSLVPIGDKKETPDLGDVYREALEWALEVVRTPLRYGDRHNGLAAYDAWADHISRDDEFATDDAEALNLRFGVHDDAVGTVAEGRWYASVFLSEMAARGGPGSAELYAASACYVIEHDLMWKIWGLVGGIGRDEAKMRKLAEPDVRRQMIPIIREARDKDAQAVDHICRALAT
jgi:hypothetical protein